MPQEVGYRRQIRPQATTPLPQASAESFGAGFGRQLAATAEGLHRDALTRYGIERQENKDEQWARFLHGYALHRENIDGVAREARKDGSAGHAARMDQAWDAARTGLLDGLTEDDVRRRATEMFEEGRLRFHIGEAQFEEVQRVDRALTDFGASKDITLNRIRRLDKPDDYLHEVEIGHEGIAALDIPDDAKAKAHRELDNEAAISFLRGRIDADPALAKAMIDKGLFDDVLQPDQVEALLNASGVEIRRQEAAARHEADLAKAEFREKVRIAKEASSQGIDVSGQLPDLVRQAGELGMPDVALELDGIGADNRFARIYENQTPVARERRLAELETKDKPTPDEQRERKWLADKQGTLDAKFEADPTGFAVRNGGQAAPPALDWDDPQSVGARSRWARGAASVYGRPMPVLTANEASDLRNDYERGRAGAVSVMDRLATLPADQAAAAAKMVDPDDRQLQVMVTLPKTYRDVALDGRDAIKANSAILKVDDDGEQEVIDRNLGSFGEATRAIAPAQREALLETARQIAAGKIAQKGGSNSANLTWHSLNMALGARGLGASQRGGLGRWSDRWFVMPDGVTASEFGQVVGRASQTGNGPVNPDGSPAILRNAWPEMVGPGTYEFRTVGGGTVKRKDGTAWRVTVRAKP